MLKVIGKRSLIIILTILFLCLLSVGFLIGKSKSYQSTRFIYYRPDVLKTMKDSSLNIPLPKPSDITVENNNIRLDLEKIAINKYFIVYNVIYGDQSHTAYHLFLTNLSREKINKNKIESIYLVTKTGKKIEPVAQKPVIRDFPRDQPLGWRVKIIAKFPYKTDRQNHNLILKYDGIEYELPKIDY